MTRVGILSDTHAHWDERYLKYFEPCDEIWHAGDIQDLRRLYPLTARFTVAGVDVLMKHIGGYPGNYDPSVRGTLLVHPPRLFISGHSHILRVKYDKTLGLLHINPGAAGTYGFHRVRTLVRLTLDEGTFRDLEVIELAEERRVPLR